MDVVDADDGDRYGIVVPILGRAGEQRERNEEDRQ